MFSALWRLFVAHRHTFGEFARFGIVGATNTVLDFGLYVGLTRGFAFWERHYVAANAIAFAVAVTSSFLFNNFWTFKKDHRNWHVRGSRFLAIAFAALGLNSLVLYALTSYGIHDLLAKLVAIAAVGFWNFSMYKMWAFRR